MENHGTDGGSTACRQTNAPVGNTASLFKLLPFFRNRKFHAAPNENEAVELGVADGASDVSSPWA